MPFPLPIAKHPPAQWHCAHSEAPLPMTRTVLDRHGKKYELEILYSEDLIRFNLGLNHQSAGYANVLIQGPHHWMIADLCIYDDSPILPPRLILYMRSLWNGEPKTRSFRGLGLGSVLLENVIGEAREYGVRKISARLWHKDRQKSSFLVQWCARHGFREVCRAPGHPRNCEVQMEINL